MSDWPSISIAECCDILDSRRVPINEEERSNRLGDVPYYGANGLQGHIDSYIFNEPLILIAEDGGYFDEYATRSIAYRIYGKSWVNNHAHILRSVSGFDQDFIFYCLEHKDVTPFIKGGTRAKLNQLELRQITIPCPPLLQQRKIARILTTVDNLIEKTEALIAKYQAIKQGMMHDLFTRGVDEHGHLRPPYEQAPELYKQSELGWIPKEWDCVTLGEVVPVAQYGISVSLDDSEGIPVLRMNNLARGVIDATDIKRSQHPEALRLLLKDRDVLFNRTNSIDHVGRTSIWKSELPESSFASYLVRLVPNVARLMPEYLVYWMNRPEVQVSIRQFATPGVHQVNINPTNLRKSLIAVPSSLGEQAAITQIVLQHEKQIVIEQLSLAKLSKQKTGLMQDLLTGKVRVKVDEAEEVAAHA